MAENKTEKATPKKREEARKKGQVARSMDVNGAVVLLGRRARALGLRPGDVPAHGRRRRSAILDAHQATRASSTSKGIGELFMTVGGHVAIGAAPVVAVCALAGVARQRRPGRLQAVAQGAQARLQEAQPAHRPQAHLRPEHAPSRRSSRVLKIGAVGGDRRARPVPQARGDGRAGRHARRRPCSRTSATLVLQHRPARRARLPGDRRRRLLLAAHRFEKKLQDGQGGGQAGAQAAGAADRGQGRPAPPRDGARPRPHDGRGPDRRRRRDQPDALLGRAALRHRQARPGRRRQGHRPARAAHPPRRLPSTASPSCPTRRSPARSTRASTSAA